MNTLKKLVTLFIISLFLPFISLSAKAEKEDIVKTGLNFGVLPVINYNTDLGFQLGAMGQIFHYGDGSIYPNYTHKMSLIAAIYSKGAKQLDLSYDSKYLIPGKRITANIQYLDSPLNGFFGFNGAVSPYYPELNLAKSSSADDGIAFYANHQKLISTMVDIQGRVADNMTWIAGVNLAHHNYSPVNFKQYKGEESLYFQYLQNGLIPSRDASGFRTEVKGGLIYDTRDFEPEPKKGLYISTTLSAGSSFSEGKPDNALMLSADFRHYIGIIPSRLVLAYQLSYQGLLAGYLPFYSLPAFGMRGAFGRRIVGNGIAKGCADIRFTAARFHAFKQNVEIGLVGFFEAGGVVQTFRLSQQKLLGDVSVTKTLDDVVYGPYNSIYDPEVGSDRERLHSCVGGGIFFSVNKNFLVSMQMGHPMNIQNGGNGVYINLGFSF